MIENIHTIIAAAAVKFSFDQLTHLFVLIQKVSARNPKNGMCLTDECSETILVFLIQSWEVESDRVRQKLLSLIGRIGREARSETTTGKVGRRCPSGIR